MNILLLGASGFVGKNIIAHFQKEGIQCISTSRKDGVDLTDFRQALDLMASVKPDLIVNAAAHVGSLNYVTELAANVILDNTRMILNTYEAVTRINTKAIIINPIANCAYPAKADTFKEDNWWDGHLHRSVLSYGSAKRLVWSVGESYEMQYGLRSVHLLVPNMYGPFDSTDPNKAHALTALVSKFVKAEHEGKKEIEIWGTGVAIREWLYAGDFARIISAVIRNPGMVGLSEPVNIGQNFGLSVKELVQIINGHFMNKFTIRWNHEMPDGAPKKVMDDIRFKKVFKNFNFTPLEEGIIHTIDYYKSIYPY